MAEIVGFMHRAMTKAVELLGQVLWRKTTGQEGGARNITAGIGILCAQSEKGRRVFLQYLAASSFPWAGPGSMECCQWDHCRSSDLITKESFSFGSLASGTKGDVYLIGCIWFFRPWSAVVHYLAWSVLKLFSRSAEISEEGENAESELKTECCFWYLG